jgi:UDP-N-acetylmuramate dehydrogenase
MNNPVQHNINLKPYNTFGIEANATSFAAFSSVESLHELISANTRPLLILGGGSNILLTKDFDGLVLKNELKGIELINPADNSVLVRSAAGETWHELVLFSISHNLGGIENLSLIPGSVGAAPMQNIGAYGVEVKDVFHELEAYEMATGKIKKFSAEKCKFGYRESVFKQELKGQYIITSVTLKLTKDPTLNTSYGAINDELKAKGITNPTIRDVSNAVISIRQSKLPDPKKIGNSGSFFKNPVISKTQFEQLKSKFPAIVSYPVDAQHVKLAAGWLIENAGWKGKTIGNYGVHKNQALVLVNYGGAAGSDIYELSEAILRSVRNLYGVSLEREVNII